MNLYAIKLRQSLRDHVVVGLMQSPLIKVLRLAVFKKQTLRFALVGGQLGSLNLEFMKLFYFL